MKWPRFAFEKFPAAKPVLGPQMKSVGEAMAIGRTFRAALGKAIRSLETGRDGFDLPLGALADDLAQLEGAMRSPDPTGCSRSFRWQRAQARAPCFGAPNVTRSGAGHGDGRGDGAAQLRVAANRT